MFYLGEKNVNNFIEGIQKYSPTYSQKPKHTCHRSFRAPKECLKALCNPQDIAYTSASFLLSGAAYFVYLKTHTTLPIFHIRPIMLGILIFISSICVLMGMHQPRIK